MTAKIGSIIEIRDIIKAVPVSTVETIGLPIPPVVTVEVNLAALEVPDIAAAVPPPAMIASAQVISGLKFTTVDNIITVPANAANGTAILSNKLSIYGMKYANISTKVATPKMINADKLPIQCQDSFKSKTLKYEDKLNANNGIKTLKPTEAANPIPRQILIIVSKFIF